MLELLPTVKRRVLAAAVLAALSVVAALPATSSASVRSCSPVINPYPGTRYEGSNLSHIRAEGIGCPKARKVTKRAHRKALGITPPPDGIRRFQWHGWTVVGDLRPSSDKYEATRGGRQVRWRF
jgi:hypothetical protein